MKIDKLLIVMLILVLLAVYYIMGTGYLKQHHNNQTLASRTEEAAQLLAQIPPSPTDLESRLSAAQSSYNKVLNSFPAPWGTTQIINSVLRLADEVSVKAVPLVTQPWTTENISNFNYSVFRLNVTATGEFAKVVDFINQLESSELSTLVIESLRIDRVTDASLADNSLPFEATLEIIVYARFHTADEMVKAG